MPTSALPQLFKNFIRKLHLLSAGHVDSRTARMLDVVTSMSNR